ncbi:MAG: AsmA family protein [Bacteroidales bacterium]
MRVCGMAARAVRVLGWIVGGLAALVALAVLFVLFVFDWNRMRGPMAERMQTVLGRGVSIDGPLRVQWGRVTAIHAEGIRIANPDWASRPDMARLAALDVEIRLLPLLAGRVELASLRLTRPDVALEKNARGDANWQFGENPRAAAAAKAVTPEKRTTFPIIDYLAVSDGQLSYLDPGQGIAIESHIATATGGDPAHEMVRLRGRGSFKDMPAEVALEAGSLLTLRDARQPYPLRAEARIGGTTASAHGTIAEPLKMQGVEMEMALSGPDMADIFPIFAIPVPPTRPYALGGHLSRQGNSWSLRDFRGRVGDSDLSGGVTVVAGGDRPLLRGNLESQRLALADLAGFIGGKPGEPDTTRAPDRVLPDQKLNLDKLRAMDAEVRFTGRRVEAPGLPIDRLEARLSIKDGHARLEPLAFAIAQGSFAGTVDLDGTRPLPHARLDMEVRRMDLHRFFGGTRFAPQTAGTLAGRLSLDGSGRSTAELLGGADGRVTLMMAGGSFSALLVEAAGLDIAKALGLALGEDRPMAVRCLVADLDLAGGTARTRALVMDTADAVITGQGSIDLGQEGMDLRLEAHPKDPSPLSARAPIRIGGRLSKPEVSVDAAAEAARGGLAVALGALLTPLAALLPFLEPGLGEDQDCRRLIAEAKSP